MFRSRYLRCTEDGSQGGRRCHFASGEEGIGGAEAPSISAQSAEVAGASVGLAPPEGSLGAQAASAQRHRRSGRRSWAARFLRPGRRRAWCRPAGSRGPMPRGRACRLENRCSGPSGRWSGRQSLAAARRPEARPLRIDHHEVCPHAAAGCWARAVREPEPRLMMPSCSTAAAESVRPSCATGRSCRAARVTIGAPPGKARINGRSPAPAAAGPRAAFPDGSPPGLSPSLADTKT